jgi:hypothetical protein
MRRNVFRMTPIAPAFAMGDDTKIDTTSSSCFSSSSSAGQSG